MRRAIPILFLVLGCGAPESGLPPELQLPDSWSEAAEPGRPTNAWWSSFGVHELDRLVAQAFDENWSIDAAWMAVQAATETMTAVTGDRLPHAALGLDLGRSRRNLIGFPIPGGDVMPIQASSHGLSLNLSWELDLWGRLEQRELAANAATVEALAAHAGAQTSLAGQVTKSWFALAEATLQLRNAEARLASAQRLAQSVESQFARGSVPADSIDRALTLVAEFRSEVAARKRLADALTRQLEVLAGRYPSAELLCEPSLPALPPAPPAGVPAELLAQRPDLRAAEARAFGARARREEARAARYPQLSLMASGGTASNELTELLEADFKTWGVGANLLAPLFAGGSLAANWRAKAALYNQTEFAFAQLALQACAEVESALFAETQLREELSRRGEAAEAGSRLYRRAERRYRAGIIPQAALTEVRIEQLRLDAARMSAHLALLQNRVDLHLALGGGFIAAAVGEDE